MKPHTHLAQSLGSFHDVYHTHMLYSYLLNVIKIVVNKTHFKGGFFVITQFLDEQITQKKTALMWETWKYF